jgi:hypothetical protein
MLIYAKGSGNPGIRLFSCMKHKLFITEADRPKKPDLPKEEQCIKIFTGITGIILGSQP